MENTSKSLTLDLKRHQGKAEELKKCPWIDRHFLWIDRSLGSITESLDRSQPSIDRQQLGSIAIEASKNGKDL